MSKALLIAMLAVVGGCGRLGPLQPALGEPLPIKPKMAATTPTPEQLLQRPPIAKPERVDELLRRSEPRRTDRFDMPPPDGGEAPDAEVEQPRSSEQAGPATPQ